MNIVYLNGKFVALEDAKVSVLDRGFLFADSVYEVMPVYAGHLFQFEQHLTRLEQSLAAISLKLDTRREKWRAICEELIHKNSGDNLLIYWQITRGVAQSRNHLLPANIKPTVYLSTSELPSFRQASDIKGISVITAEDIRWQRCDIKTTALLANCLLQQMALESGADDTILVRKGKALEASASNFFMVKEGVLITPPLSKQLLAGVTRDFVLHLAEKLAIPVEQRDVFEAELATADEIWLTSSSKEITPVIRLNGDIIGQGECGPMWQQMFAQFQQLKQQLYAGEIRSSQDI